MGILVFELLAGQAPFEKESRLETYHNILSGEPEFPAWLSPGAVSFIKIALCKDANNRPTAEKLYRHPWLQSFVASKQEFRSSTGGIREKTLSAIPKQKSPENTSSSASSVPTLNRSLLTDPAAKPETTQEGQSTDKILRQISASGQNILKPNESFSATSFNGTAEWDLSIQNSMSVEKMSYESSILYGSSGSSARNGSFLDVLASGSSGSKPYCISNNGSSPSPPGQSQMIQHMLANASPTLGGGSPVPFNRQVSLPFTPHPPPLIHLHSLQHQPPLPPSSSKGSGSSRTNRPPPLNTPPSILESIPGSSKPSSSGSSFSQSNSLATVVEKAAGGAGEKTSAFLPGPASMSIYHPLHRMKLQVQVHAEMSQSNSEGQVSTPLSTPGSNQPTPSGPSSGNLSPYGFLHQKRASHQGSAMPSILRSPSMVNKTPESPGT